MLTRRRTRRLGVRPRPTRSSRTRISIGSTRRRRGVRPARSRPRTSISGSRLKPPARSRSSPAQPRRPTIPLEELIGYVFGPDRSALAAEVGMWLVASPRFRTFAETYRDKIRKKARGPRDDEGRRDLAFELSIAVRLLEERRFTVEYEPYGMAIRAPDFRVSFRTNVRFNVEVRRLRLAPTSGAAAATGQLVRAICDKLGQLPPAMINVLVLGAEGSSFAADALPQAMVGLQDRATRKDEAFF